MIGASAGLGGAALMELLHAVQHLAWSYERVIPGRRPNARPMPAGCSCWPIGGVIAGVGAVGLARLGGVGGLRGALWLRAGAAAAARQLRARGGVDRDRRARRLARPRGRAPAGRGGGRESRLSDWARLPVWQRRLLVASGAGAGMAAVYNVPLGGALFALEVLLGTLSLPLVLPALATSLIATAVAWVALARARPTSSRHTMCTPRRSSGRCIVGPIAGLASVAYIHLISRAHALRPAGWRRVAAPIVVFTALGVVAIAYPQVLGNGKGVVQLALVGRLAVGVMAVLIVLKPLATAGVPGQRRARRAVHPDADASACVLGGVLGDGWLQIWPGTPLGSYAVIGGAAVLAASMQAPLAAVVLLLELTHKVDGLMVPMLLAVVGATVISRLLRAPLDLLRAAPGHLGGCPRGQLRRHRGRCRSPTAPPSPTGTSPRTDAGTRAAALSRHDPLHGLTDGSRGQPACSSASTASWTFP